MIQIIDGFNLQTSTPIDSRIVVADDAEKALITSTYPGLRIWQVDTNTPYFWDESTGTPAWKSELDLVVTGVDSDVTDGVIPKFSSIDPIQIKDSIMVESIDSGGTPKITISNGHLDVDQDLTFSGELFGNINANNITTGHLDLERLNVGSGGDGFVLQINSSGIPEFVSLSGISIGSSATSNQVKLNDVNSSNYYKFTLRHNNTTTLGTSTSSFQLYSYTTDLLLSQSSGSMCILAHGGSKENPPYSFYDTTSTSPYGILGGMYYSGDSIDFSIGSEPKFKIKDDGVYIEPDTTNNPSKFTNVKNSIGVPVGGIIMWSGDESEIGTGDLWNYMLCDNSTVSGPFTDNYGTSFTPTYVGSTPNLVNKFIIAAGDSYDTGDEGGDHNRELTVENIPSHTHNLSGSVSGTTDDDGLHSHVAKEMKGGPLNQNGVIQFKGVQNNATSSGDTDNYETILDDGLHTHTFSGSVSGTTDGGINTDGNSFDNRPRFFALAFIIRVV